MMRIIEFRNAGPRTWGRTLTLCSLIYCALTMGFQATAAENEQSAHANDTDDLLVFAASSLRTPLNEIARNFSAETSADVKLVFGASGSLARQISSGAPAHLFLSADHGWSDWLRTQRASLPPPQAFARNRLVVVYWPDEGDDATVLPELLSQTCGVLTMANPDTAPLGRYSRQALQGLGVWQKALPRIATLPSAQGALRMLQTRAATIGLIYASDAFDGPQLITVPESLHDPISYVAINTSLSDRESDLSNAFMEYLLSVAGQDILIRHGFTGAPNNTQQ